MESVACLVIALSAVSFGNEISICNNCPFTIWPGILGNPGMGQPDDGGFELGSKQSRTVTVQGNWQGRIWARTNCDVSGHCATGDCGGKIQCGGAGGVPPVSLAEITFAGAGGMDFYDVSIVDGYNLPIKITPVDGSYNTGDTGTNYCKAAGCVSDLNADCPAELAVKSGQWTVACMSACMKFNNDQYCCRGAYGSPNTCKPAEWPFDYASVFKKACPDAYSYAYDDGTSTFTCKGNPATKYTIAFCP